MSKYIVSHYRDGSIARDFLFARNFKRAKAIAKLRYPRLVVNIQWCAEV